MNRTSHLKLSEEETLERIRQHPGEVVLRIIERPEWCGFWLPPFDAEELERWWLEQESIPFFWDPSESIIELEGRHFGTRPEDYGRFFPPGVFLYDGTQEWFHDLWDKLRASGKHYEGVICCDTDSYLQRPDGTRIFHKGARADEQLIEFRRRRHT